MSQGRIRDKTEQNPGTSRVTYALFSPCPSMLLVFRAIKEEHSLRSLELALAGESLHPKGRMMLQLIPEE